MKLIKFIKKLSGTIYMGNLAPRYYTLCLILLRHLKRNIKKHRTVGRPFDVVQIRQTSRAWQIIKLHSFTPNWRQVTFQTYQTSAHSQTKQTRSPIITSKIWIILLCTFGIGFVRKKGVFVNVDTAVSLSHIRMQSITPLQYLAYTLTKKH